MADLTGNGQGTSISICDWKLFRALVLLFPLQPVRLPSSAVPDRLEQIMALKDSEIDFIAHHWSQRYKVVRVRSNPTRPMFYPEAGHFLLPEFGAGQIPKAMVAIPVTQNFAFAMIPIDCDPQRLVDLWTGDLVSGLSVGLRSNRVVLPPAILDCVSEDAVKAGIEAERAAAASLFSSLGDLKAALGDWA